MTSPTWSMTSSRFIGSTSTSRPVSTGTSPICCHSVLLVISWLLLVSMGGVFLAVRAGWQSCCARGKNGSISNPEGEISRRPAGTAVLIRDRALRHPPSRFSPPECDVFPSMVGPVAVAPDAGRLGFHRVLEAVLYLRARPVPKLANFGAYGRLAVRFRM